MSNQTVLDRNRIVFVTSLAIFLSYWLIDDRITRNLGCKLITFVSLPILPPMSAWHESSTGGPELLIYWWLAVTVYSVLPLHPPFHLHQGTDDAAAISGDSVLGFGPIHGLYCTASAYAILPVKCSLLQGC